MCGMIPGSDYLIGAIDRWLGRIPVDDGVKPEAVDATLEWPPKGSPSHAIL
jgi:hypothetical protein